MTVAANIPVVEPAKADAQRCTGSTCTNFVQVGVVGANTRSFSNSGLAGNTIYRYRVRAFKGGDYRHIRMCC